MLPCPPTRLSLTVADVQDFDQKFRAKQAARHIHARETGLRVAPSAQRLTKLDIVTAEANQGRQRAESSSSQATICSADEVWEQDNDQAHHNNARFDHARARDLKASQEGCLREAGDSAPRNIRRMREYTAVTPRPTSNAERATRMTCTGWRRVPKVESLHPPAPPIPEHAVRSILTQSSQSPSHDSSTLELSLDPGAPVFIPQMRLGSTASLSAESDPEESRNSGQQRNLHGIHSSTHLRIRPSFERNAQALASDPGHQHTSLEVPTRFTPVRLAHSRGGSRSSDQNAALRGAIAGLDRHPPTQRHRASPSINDRSTHNTQVPFPMRPSSQHSPATIQRARRRTSPIHNAEGAARRPPPATRLRSTSPVTSISSSSTPNFFRASRAPSQSTLSRSSSLTSKDNVASPRRDGLRCPDDTTRWENELVNVLEENWLSRNSPLDELAQQLSRMVTHPRSVGRLSERHPGNSRRKSPLTGGSFRLDQCCERSSGNADNNDLKDGTLGSAQTPVEHMSAAPNRTMGTFRQAKDDLHEYGTTCFGSEDPVALALALSPPEIPLSPAARTSPSPPGTSSVHAPLIERLEPGITSSPTAVHSRDSANSSTAPARDTINTAIPRLSIYDDSKSPETQPRTPADISRNPRRARRCSDMTTAALVSSSKVHTPTQPAASGGTTVDRSTYPASSWHLRTSPDEERNRSRAWTSVVRRDSAIEATASENDIESNLHDLEADRRTWIDRRQDGSLDVTPPKEGRFERFLS